MELTEWERNFLKYYLNNFGAKWMRVYNNKHPLLDTRIQLYTVYKRLLKNQAKIGETYISMFNKLEEGKWYFIPDLLENEGGDKSIV